MGIDSENSVCSMHCFRCNLIVHCFRRNPIVHCFRCNLIVHHCFRCNLIVHCFRCNLIVHHCFRCNLIVHCFRRNLIVHHCFRCNLRHILLARDLSERLLVTKAWLTNIRLPFESDEEMSRVLTSNCKIYDHFSIQKSSFFRGNSPSFLHFR